MIGNRAGNVGMLATVYVLLSQLLLSSMARAAPEAYDKISFTNVGFTGSFNPVKKLSNVDDDDCSCQVGDPEWFSGTNAPLSEYLSVHFRGPLTLKQFAFYSSPAFVVNNNRSSSAWSRQAYYDASSQTTENVTFLTKAGKNSKCLGKALTYASSNGTGAADKATPLEENNYISSDEEYAIFSNVSCPSSGTGKGCGVYRSGIPAYYGFGGITKMFLFEFEMPTEKQANNTSFEYYDLPAIWLLNDHIPRTSQYPSNTNCSCWISGCGEFDIFEIMNGTERNHLYSTFHTFQGIEDLGTGIQADGYIQRDTTGTMKGGVIFDSSGNTITFVSNSTSFDSTLSVDEVNSLLSGISTAETYSTQLATISATAPSTTSKSNGVSLNGFYAGIWYYVFIIFAGITQVFLI